MLIDCTIKEKIDASSLEEANANLAEIAMQKNILKAKIAELETIEFYWREIRNHFCDQNGRLRKFKP